MRTSNIIQKTSLSKINYSLIGGFKSMKMIEAVVAKIERDRAVLLLGEERYRVDIPLKFLPDNVKESDVVRLDFVIEREEAREHVKRIKQIIRRLQAR